MRCILNGSHWTQVDTVEIATAQEAVAYPPISTCCVTLSKSQLVSRAQDSHM